MSVFHTGCPVAKKGMEKFVQYLIVGGERQRIEFEREILWLQQSEATVRAMHGGEVVDTLSTSNDFYGYLTSFSERNAVGEAVQYANRFSVTAESSMSVEVFVRVMLVPCVETKECAEHNRTKPSNYKAQYAYLPDDWRKEVIENGERLYPMLTNQVLVNEVVWSSKNTPEQNKEIADQFIEKWSMK